MQNEKINRINKLLRHSTHIMSTKLETWLSLAKSFLEQPTAALMEVLPVKFIREFAAARPNLKLTQDAAGNLRVDYVSGASRPPLALVAHMDHPAFHVEKVDGATAALKFQGWVSTPHAQPGSRVHFFELGNPQPIGEGELVDKTEDGGHLDTATFKITSGKASPSGFAMWAFPAFSIENGLIVTRSCDDSLGCAAALCVLDEISKLAPPNVSVTGLFTRAEEIGFLGALEAIRLNTLPKNACVLSLETSKAFTNAPQGGGAIVRVGDLASIFDTGLTAALTAAAKKRAKHDPTFKFQRKLMDGGTCEATPFCAHGYRASGMAVPLGNYHNQGFDAQGKPCIGPETVNVEDFRCEIELLIELSLHPELLDKEHERIPERIQELEKKATELLIQNERFKMKN